MSEALQIMDAVGKVLPSVVGWIGSLIKAGMSAGEAGEVVKRDIESRAAEYERMKAEDVAALRAKWAAPSIPGNPYAEPKEG